MEGGDGPFGTGTAKQGGGMNSRLLAGAGLALRVLPPRWKAAAAGCSEQEYEGLMSSIQRFRGGIYRADGAIPAHALDPWGRHFTAFDFKNYHILMQGPCGEIAACFRLCAHSRGTRAPGLRIHEVLTRMPPSLAQNYHQAIEACISQSYAEGLSIGEVGGWAVSPAHRHSRTTMMLPFVAWSLFQIIGNATAFAFATNRHASARLLRRIGYAVQHQGSPLPRHHDPYYGCSMELLAFNSRQPTPAYQGLVEDLRAHLLHTQPWLTDPLWHDSPALLERAA